MKIIYLHQYFNTADMSGGTRSYEVARRLVTMGHEVHMITSWREPKDDPSWFTTEENGIQVHWLPVAYNNHMSYAQRIKAFIKFALSSRDKATEIGGDIVFATSTPLTICIPGILASKKLNIPMVFEVRDLWPELPIAMGALKNPFMKLMAHKLEKWAYKNSEAVIALSPGMKDGVCKTGYPASNVAVIPNSSDIELFQNPQPQEVQAFRQSRPWLQDNPLIIYAGTFGKINGVAYLADLAAQVYKLDKTIRFLAIGDGFDREYIQQKAQDLGVLNVNFFMEAPVSKNTMPTIFSAATMTTSLFIDLPAMRANSANKFFDAMAAGKPIFINYGGWQNKLLDTKHVGINGWQLPLEEVARNIVAKVHDKEWLSTTQSHAFELAQTHFDRNVLAKQIAQILTFAVDKRGAMSESVAPSEKFL